MLQSFKLYLSALLFTPVVITSATNWSWLEEMINNQTFNSTFEKLFEEHASRFRNVNTQKWRDFPCRPFAQPRRNVTVHTLSPGDIKVVAALGDSVTAGFGVYASTIPELFINYRGLSFSIGGDGNIDEHITLPNIIKMYNPNVKGYSVGTGLSTSKDAHLNMAITAEVSYGLRGQTRHLIRKMQSKAEGIDYENDWKIITIMMGINSICHSCEAFGYYSASNYRKNMQQTLDILHNEVPKAFVNVLLVPHREEGSNIHGGQFCDLTTLSFCPCQSIESIRKKTRQLKRLYNEALGDLIYSGRYDTRDDFAVVIQPFFESIQMPHFKNGSQDLGFLAIDCYHPSLLGHSLAAEGLWNNMLQPIGEKTRRITLSFDVLCPSAVRPYFCTRQNSQSGKLTKHDSDVFVVNKMAPSRTDRNVSSALSKFGISTAVFAAVSILGIALYKISKGGRMDSGETEILL